MRLLKKAFTLIELQIASILMIIVLIATGVIFYFALASLRYMHDAFVVYANATSAIKAISDEVMVSNCYGSAQDASGSIPQPGSSFWAVDGYIHGSLPDGSPPPGGYAALGLSGMNAFNALSYMPDYSAGGGNVLYLRQATQVSAPMGTTAPSVAGDFPSHDSVAFYLSVNTNGISELQLEHIVGGGYLVTSGSDQVVAEHVTAFGFSPVSYNCLTVFLTVTGTMPSPLGGDVHQVNVTKVITLRCAPASEPWL
jgi:hypothetical protein